MDPSSLGVKRGLHSLPFFLSLSYQSFERSLMVSSLSLNLLSVAAFHVHIGSHDTFRHQNDRKQTRQIILTGSIRKHRDTGLPLLKTARILPRMLDLIWKNK